jgi:DNA-binding PadR family transcriptional regulator
VTVLDELLRAPAKWRYGYDLMKATGLAAGTLYPILARLSDYGWLESSWDDPAVEGRPPRHQYKLTPNGRIGARAMRERAAATLPGFRAR